MPSFELLPEDRLSRSVLSNRIDAVEQILPKREYERTVCRRAILENRDSAFVIAKQKLVLGDSLREREERRIAVEECHLNSRSTDAEGIERLTSKMSHDAGWRELCVSTDRDRRWRWL